MSPSNLVPGEFVRSRRPQTLRFGCAPVLFRTKLLRNAFANRALLLRTQLVDRSPTMNGTLNDDFDRCVGQDECNRSQKQRMPVRPRPSRCGAPNEDEHVDEEAFDRHSAEFRSDFSSRQHRARKSGGAVQFVPAERNPHRRASSRFRLSFRAHLASTSIAFRCLRGASTHRRNVQPSSSEFLPTLEIQEKQRPPCPHSESLSHWALK